MSPVTHALVGAVLGQFLGRPGRAFLTGIAPHTVLDYLPHNDSHDPFVLLGNGCGVFAILAAASFAGHDGMLAGALGGILPDMEHARPGNSRPEVALFPGHRFRHEGRYAAGLGRGVEGLLAAAALVAFFLAGATNGRRPGAGGIRAGA